MATKRYAAGVQGDEPQTIIEEEVVEFPRLAAEGLKGLLRITGLAALAMLAGYSAGYAMANYQDSHGRNSRAAPAQ